MSGNISKLFKGNRFLNVGLPFFVLIIGGSFLMTNFTQVRYDHRKQKTLTPAEAEKLGVKMKKPGEVTLEKEFAKMQNMDIDTWENKRGPRPWEDNNPTNLELEQRAKNKGISTQPS